jgi:hypothetical protein
MGGGRADVGLIEQRRIVLLRFPDPTNRPARPPNKGIKASDDIDSR